MPVYKDEERKTWYCSFYYVNWKGERKLKKKRGFKTQREAKEYEREFKSKSAGEPEMKFSSLYELYIQDLDNRIRISTKEKKENIYNKHILPYFKDLKINEITTVIWHSIKFCVNYFP